MGLQSVMQNAVSAAFTALGDIVKTGYYHQTGASTYSPLLGTNAEADAVSILAKTDIAAVALTNELTSVSTEFTDENILTATYIKVSGFATSGNNDFVRASTIATNSIILNSSDITLTDEAEGESVSITGMYEKVSVVKTDFEIEEIDGENIRKTDQKILIPALDLSVTPRVDDYVEIDGEVWYVQSIETDPAGAMYILQGRLP